MNYNYLIRDGKELKIGIYAAYFDSLDPRFIFINSGYNVRPTDIQAAIGLSQFRRKEVFKENRKYNRELIINNSLENNVFIYGSKNDIGNILSQSDIAILTSNSEG